MTITRLNQLTAETQYISDLLTDGVLAATISSSKAKTGTYSYAFASTTKPTGMALSNKTEIRAGVWINHIDVSDEGVIFRWYHADSHRSEIHWDNGDNNIYYIHDGTIRQTIGQAAANINRTDTWMHLAITIKDGSFVTVYLDGIALFSHTGATDGAIVSFYFGGASSLNGWNSTTYFDDFYIDDTTGESDAVPPQKRFLFQLVNGAGADAQFTPSAGSNFQNVDDAGAPDEDTTYNKGLSSGLKDTFNTAPVTVPTDHVIRARITLAIAKKTDGGTNSQIKLHTYDGSTYQSGSAQSLTTAYATKWERQVLQPDGTAWNETDANSMQDGYESAGSF